MPIVTQVICDHCPKVKGEKNGWWVLIPEGTTGFAVYPLDHMERASWDRPGMKILCSVNCLCEEIRMRTEKSVTATPAVDTPPLGRPAS